VSHSPTVAGTPLPCTRDPDRWFDRRDHTYAFRACVACPARRWCAERALAQRPSWGMWAGVWIDGDLDRVTAHLSVIASTPRPAPSEVGPPSDALSTRAACDDSATSWDGTAAGRIRRRPSVRAMLLARSSGHCEVMVAECRLAADLTLSRIDGGVMEAPESPRLAYLSCRQCADVVAALGGSTSRYLGYAGLPRGDAAAHPFLWRQAHWVWFDAVGGMHAASAAAETA
jgi:hypothetical protein